MSISTSRYGTYHLLLEHAKTVKTKKELFKMLDAMTKALINKRISERQYKELSDKLPTFSEKEEKADFSI